MQTSTVLPRMTRGTSDYSPAPVNHDRLTVSVAQADSHTRESLAWLLETEGYKVAGYETGEMFLRACDPRATGCFVLDLQLPDMTPAELLQRLRRLGCQQPYLITADACDAVEAVELLHSGAMDLLVKPWREERFLASVTSASLQHLRWTTVQSRLDRLTAREQQVLELVIAGLPTKQIARRLDISPRTVDVHRSNISKKLGVSSLAALVQMVIEHESLSL